MKNVLVILLISLVLIFASFFVIKNYLWVNVVFNNKDARATNFKPNKFLTEGYISLVYLPRIKGINVSDQFGIKTKIYPKTIGIFITDKIRVENDVSKAGKKIFGSTLTKENQKVALLYIWAHDDIFTKPNYTKEIINYIYNSIKHYQTNVEN